MQLTRSRGWRMGLLVTVVALLLVVLGVRKAVQEGDLSPLRIVSTASAVSIVGLGLWLTFRTREPVD